MNPIETLLKVLGFAVDVVERVSDARSERPSKRRAPRSVPASRPPPPIIAPHVAVGTRPHLWCVTANGRGRGRSVEHCAYCNVPKREEIAHAMCPERRGE